jgi:hypothetical protein
MRSSGRLRLVLAPRAVACAWAAVLVGLLRSGSGQAAAEGDAAAPDVAVEPSPTDCIFRVPDTAVPLPQVALPPGPIPGFGTVVLVAPPVDTGPIPRNVELLLAGELAELDQGLLRLRVLVDGVDVAFTRDAHRVVVDGGLPPGRLLVTITSTPQHPCPECVGPQSWAFDVLDLEYETPPSPPTMLVHAFRPPPAEEQARCGNFFGQNDIMLLAWETAEPMFARVFVRSAATAPQLLADGLVLLPGVQALNVSVDLSVLPPDEPVVVVVATRDYAGNVGPPVTQRVRRRPLSDVDESVPTMFDLEPNTCELPSTTGLAVPSVVPRNAVLRVLFAMEEIPLGLRRVGAADDVVPLVPDAAFVEDGRAGRFLTVPLPVPAGTWDVVDQPCDRCRCPTCALPLAARVEIADVIDTAAPAAPAVVGVIDDPAPARSDGPCRPDRAGTFVVLRPGVDDVSPPLDLTYDAVLTDEAGLRRPVAQGVLPLRRADGDVVLRLPTAPFGRVVGAGRVLELVARDAAGNLSPSASFALVDAGPSSPASCAAGSRHGDAALLTLLVLVVRRRRGRGAG